MIFNIIVDDKVFRVCKTTINNYPNSVLADIVNRTDIQTNFVHVEDRDIYLDMDIRSISLIVDYIRGYAVDFSSVDMDTIERVCRDAMLLKLNDLSDSIQEHLSIHKELRNSIENLDSISDTLRTMVSTLKTTGLLKDQVYIDVLDIVGQYVESKEFKELMRLVLMDYGQSYKHHVIMKVAIQNIMNMILLFIKKISVNVLNNKNMDVKNLIDNIKTIARNDDIDTVSISSEEYSSDDDVNVKLERLSDLQTMVKQVGGHMLNLLSK